MFGAATLGGHPASAATPQTQAAMRTEEVAVVLDALKAALSSTSPGKGAGRRRRVERRPFALSGPHGPEGPGRRPHRGRGAALGDKHVYVRAPGDRSMSATARDPNARAAAEARAAYGLEAVRRLPGNIGYLDVRMFGMTPESGVRMDAAMDLLSDTEALIIDLRQNGGGGGRGHGRSDRARSRRADPALRPHLEAG
jgi:hypothetical protein